MKNILFISQWLSMAGTETFMINVLRNIDRQKFHIDFLLFSNSTSFYSVEAEQLGSNIYRLPPRNRGFNYYKSLNAFFKEKASQYSAIHYCGGNVSSIAPIYYAYKYNIPVRIVHSHNSSSQGLKNKIMHLINRNFLTKLSTCNLACSTLASKYFFGKKPCIIVKNGINVDSYRFNEERRNKLRSEYGISLSTHVLGHIGRFEDVKNHSFLLDIFCEYKKIHAESKLLLIGSGILEDKIKQKAKDLGLEEDILFLGLRNDIPDILCSMDCFVMPSLFEGLPFVLVEAQATGLPCVIADTINKDAKLTPYLLFRSLRDNLGLWVEDIKTIIRANNREKGTKYIDDNGFNILSTVKYLEYLYDEK